MKFFTVLMAVLLIPLLTLGVAILPFWDAGLKDPSDLAFLYSSCLKDPSADAICQSDALWLGWAAIATALVGVSLLIAVKLAAILTGWHRSALALAFPPVAFIALLVCGLVAVAQGLLLAGSIYILEGHFLGTVHPILVIAVSVMAIGAGSGVIISALNMFRRAETTVVGLAIRPIDAPHIHRVVAALCRKLKTKPPTHIVLGLDATFFATSAHVRTPFEKSPMKGETLYLSLPLLRMLSEAEITSVIGHELAHFSGADTTFSKRFAPVYRGLHTALGKLRGEDNRLGPLTLPSSYILGFVLDTFSRASGRISREREIRADKFGAEAGSPEALSDALMKVSVLSAIWSAEFDEMVARVGRGRFSRNLSRNFVDRTRYDIDHDKISGLAVLGMEREVPHPTDTHPVTSDRIEALGLDPETFADVDRLKASIIPEKTLVARSDSIEKIEERLTDVYQQIIAHQTGVSEDEGVQSQTAFSNVLSMFLATMTLADGHVDDREIDVAQTEALKYDNAFDPVSFKEYCRHPDDIPPVEKLIYWGNMMLNTGGAERLREILHKIAAADGNVDVAEQALLDRFDQELIGEDPPPQSEKKV
ncbi:MAG: M48 family metalloprotease [Hyphomonadaceae bacterium]